MKSQATPVLSRRFFLSLTLPVAALALAVANRGGAAVLHSTDFNSGSPWGALATFTTGTGPTVGAVHSVAGTGTIDSSAGVASGAVTVTVNASAAVGGWSAGVSSGRLAVTNSEAHLGKLTLGFDLAPSIVRPVRVRVQSFAAASGGVATGTREAVVVPPVAGSFYRYGLDLSAMTPVGAGAFDPLAPYVQIQFEINGGDGVDPWPAQAGHTLRVDNVSYTSPAYYVSSRVGSNSFDGRTEARPFATIQKAVDVAQPGDVLMVMEGTYTNSSYYLGVSVTKAGSPARWIVLRAHPDGTPATYVSAPANWSAIRMDHNAAYVEIRGLTWKGNRGNVNLGGAEADYEAASATPAYNGNGIDVVGNGGSGTNRPHHIRVIGNRIYEQSGGGSGGSFADYLTWEGNIIYGNCWYMRYAGSGISYLGLVDVDGTTTASAPIHKSFIIGNIVYRNQCFVKWKQIGKYSDGNGIILDSYDDYNYAGRTLVQNNVSFGNGGSGIHSFRGQRLDIVNNTAFYNGQTPQTRYGQIFAQRSIDVRIANNILWSQQGGPINSVGFSTDTSNVGLVHTNNLYYGDGTNYVVTGVGDLRQKPLFVKLPTLTGQSPDPSVNADVGAFDFRLLAGSPGIDYALLTLAGAPRVDLLGRHRPLGGGADVGAYEFDPAPAILVAPASRTVSASATAVFGVTAVNATAYQWRKDGVAIPGATSATLVIPGATAAEAGAYSCIVTNAFGSATSDAGTLAISASADFGRIINLAVRTRSGAGDQVLNVGLTVGGAGTNGPKLLLLRVTGPALAAFGVTSTMTDPTLELRTAGANTAAGSNDNWGTATGVAATATAVGAFPLTDMASKDAALVTSLPNGGYAALAAGVGGGTGIVLTEIYDASPSMTVATPRLINVSARAQVNTGDDVLIAGFVIGGATAKTVLIRATGPALTAYGVTGILADPKLELFDGASVLLKSNDDWGGEAAVSGAAAAVGAFPLIDVASKDAVLLITLPPGSYSAKVSGANNATGVALIEVYEVP